jgi:hypothetical protein
MTTPLFSAYVSAFNLLSNGFDWQTSLSNMLVFFDEVVVAVNTSTDETAMALRAFFCDAVAKGKMKVVETSFVYTDVAFDGAIKNAALQACSQGTEWIYVQMDLDEMIPLGQKPLWRKYAEYLQSTPGIDCLMIPSIDLWGSMETIRRSKNIGLKFRMHKAGLKRGVWKRAWIMDGKRFDTSMSDSCELLTQDGELCRATRIVDDSFLIPQVCSMLKDYPHVFHLGYVDYDQRVRVNKAIWAEHWPLRSGREENVATSVAELTGEPVMKHGLPIA